MNPFRAYVGQGLRRDLEQLENHAIDKLIKGLERRGVSKTVIDEALAEAGRD